MPKFSLQSFYAAPVVVSAKPRTEDELWSLLGELHETGQWDRLVHMVARGEKAVDELRGLILSKHKARHRKLSDAKSPRAATLEEHSSRVAIRTLYMAAGGVLTNLQLAEVPPTVDSVTEGLLGAFGHVSAAPAAVRERVRDLVQASDFLSKGSTIERTVAIVRAFIEDQDVELDNSTIQEIGARGRGITTMAGKPPNPIKLRVIRKHTAT